MSFRRKTYPEVAESLLNRLLGGVSGEAHPYPPAKATREPYRHALERPPVDRITFTPPVVTAARRVLVIAHGRAKTTAMRATLYDADDRLRVPAQIIRDATGEVTVLMDVELAKGLDR